MHKMASELGKLGDGCAEILWRRRFNRDRSPIDVGECDLFGVERKAGDQGALFFAGGGAVIAFELAEE